MPLLPTPTAIRWLTAAASRSHRWFRKRRLARLGYAEVSLPAFVFELDVLDGDRIRVGVEVRKRLVFRYPAAKDLVSNCELAGFVVHLDDDVFPKVLEGHLGSQARAKVPHFIGPLLELGVVGYSALQRDRVKFGAPGRFPGARRVAALPVLDHFS